MTTTRERGATYGDVFAADGFRVLFGSFALLVAGDQVKMLALAALVHARTGSAGLSAAAYMLGFLPYVVGGTFLISLADRIRPRPLMVAGELVRVATCLLLALAGMPVWAMLALVLATGVLSPVFGAARTALLPDLLAGDAFVLARSVLGVTAAGAQVGGLALGGGLLAATGSEGALLVTAGLSALAAVVLRAGLPDLPGRGRGEGGAVRETLRVNRALLTDARVRGLLLAQWLPVSFVTGAEAVLVPYLGGTAGIALTAASAGLALGSFAVGRFVSPEGRERLALPLAVAGGVPLLGFAFQPGLAGTALLVLLATAAGGSYALGLQRRFVDVTPEAVRGQAFGLLGTGAMTGQAVGAALAGAAAEWTAPHLAVALAGTATIICSLALRRSLHPDGPGR
ncbi:membrane protein [Planomonospora parontospora subsp. parontospora]|uniref:Membrane protein n=2 Tax=Planomonospora parontospora TaxID=58119 RepID=A0AA37BCS6_9ACTN|nr:MFS transporter [Planomonospora parontospora]GGK51632.1 membrane protein [Planomonospora parontospora]GII06969.1 membrane protein [Planomonospora parontospora subsp. parontospora]